MYECYALSLVAAGGRWSSCCCCCHRCYQPPSGQPVARRDRRLRVVREPYSLAKLRRDAVCCSVRCRQARHRFLRAVGHAEPVAPWPPAPAGLRRPAVSGKARLYRDHPDYGGEVDHAELIERLAAYDGWAVSRPRLDRPPIGASWLPRQPGLLAAPVSRTT